MRTSTSAKASMRQVLLFWGAALFAQGAAALTPAYSADQIAATVAASGNPAGG